MQYPWPGNIRQLKNVVDSMTVQCESREITAEELARFIPADHQHTQMAPLQPNTLPAHVGNTTQNLDTEALMRHIKDLTRQVAFLTEEVKALWQRMEDDAPKDEKNGQLSKHLLLPETSGSSHRELEEVEFEDVANETTTATPIERNVPKTREEMERELILQSLRRNNFNRRKAAAELGISERTLYRKIEKYGMDQD